MSETPAEAAAKAQSFRLFPLLHHETNPVIAHSQNGDRRTTPRDGSTKKATRTRRLGGPMPNSPRFAASAYCGAPSCAEESENAEPKQAALYARRSARTGTAAAQNRTKPRSLDPHRTRNPRKTATGAAVYSEMAARLARKPASRIFESARRRDSSAETAASHARKRTAAVHAWLKKHLP